jgi:hypothetical protein
MSTTSLPERSSVQATPHESFAEELQRTMAAVSMRFRWFGITRSVTATQKNEAAETFNAEGRFVSMGKKLIDTSHPAWKGIVKVRGKIQKHWEQESLPFPLLGVRLVRRSELEAFLGDLRELQDELREAEQNLHAHYDQLRTQAQRNLGSLHDPANYPPSLIGMFTVTWDFPNVDAPAYLRALSPLLYAQEQERVRSLFTEAVTLAEDAFFGELIKMVDHLAERLSGSEDGKPKVFRDTAVTNLMDFFERFQRLNIGSSEDLDRLVGHVRQIVGGVTPQSLRDSHVIRQQMSNRLSVVQSELDGLMVDRPRRNLMIPRATAEMSQAG